LYIALLQVDNSGNDSIASAATFRLLVVYSTLNRRITANAPELNPCVQSPSSGSASAATSSGYFRSTSSHHLLRSGFASTCSGDLRAKDTNESYFSRNSLTVSSRTRFILNSLCLFANPFALKMFCDSRSQDQLDR